MRRALGATLLGAGVLLGVAGARTTQDASLDPRARFEAGVQAYRAGDHETAANLWRRLLEERAEGLDPAALCYDLGNTAFRRERPLEAVGWYSAAVRLSPRDRDAWANLELARDRAGLEPADRGDLSSTLRRLVSSATLAEAEWAVLLLALALAAALVAEALRGGVVLRRAAGVLLVLLLLACVPWGWRLAQQGRDALFVVATGGATLHSEPREAAAAIGRADAGSEVERLDAQPGWVRVRAADGARGWLRTEDVLPLAPGAAPRGG